MKYGKIYTYKDLEEAKSLLGKEVIFSNSLRQITEFPETCDRAILRRIIDSGNVEQEAFFSGSETTFYYQFIRYVDNPITPQEFAEKMKSLAMDGETKVVHGEMDDLMCEVLKSLGYGEGVEIFEYTVVCVDI